MPGSLSSSKRLGRDHAHGPNVGIKLASGQSKALEAPAIQRKESTMRPSGRKPDQLRAVSFERGFTKHAEGSCLVRFGDTHVLCTASLEEKVPPWLKGGGKGWVTAEYGMLPRATGERMRREAAAGKQSGRTQEIQRLVGRSLRAVVDLVALGETPDHARLRCASRPMAAPARRRSPAAGSRCTIA